MSKKVMVGISLMVVTGLVVGLWVWTSAGRNQKTATDAAAVAVPVELRDMSEKIEATGTVASSQNGDIYPAYEATVQRIIHQAGETVKKGDLLMVLDSSTLTEQWATAESNVTKAKLNLSQAEDELEQVQILFKAQGATVDEVDSAQKQVALYREELNLAQVSLDGLREKPDGANFFSPGQHKLEIRAPFDGEVAWVNVKPGDKVTTQTLLLNLVAHRAMEITVSVDESEIGQVKPGQRASVALNDADQTEVPGVVSRVGRTGAEESGVVVFPVTIRVDQGRAQARLRPGMSADVTIYASSTGKVLAIPTSAVIDRQGQTLVRLWDPTEPKFVPVILGVRNGSFVEVRSGLKEGDRVMLRRTVGWQGNGQGNGQQGNSQGNRQGNRPAGTMMPPPGPFGGVH
ncbi:MAG: efflux RND transporter periplasmic adaptor subunit [Syntrophothermus sp.]